MQNENIKSICFSCGSYEIYHDGMCKKCFVEKNPLIFPVKNQNAIFCSKCGEINYRMRAFHFPKDIPRFMNELKKLIKINKATYESVNLQFDVSGLIQHKSVEVTASSEDIVQKHAILFNIVQSLCQVCRRKGSDFYSTIVQLRGFDEDIIEATLKNFEDIISKVEKAKNRVDIFFTDSRKAEKYVGAFILSNTKKDNSVKIATTRSKKLDGMDKSGIKRYKMTVLVKKC
ncbi:MAG: hypothetical protein CVU81_00490 [Euryarchaeota archaeon HGW-Euryarchaeota-1]|nr:MAG: hypothetical protein CVU81_00490 [Euryarchaeota archaeon HGW-Euryarchaeota-1]